MRPQQGSIGLADTTMMILLLWSDLIGGKNGERDRLQVRWCMNTESTDGDKKDGQRTLPLMSRKGRSHPHYPISLEY